MFTESIDVHRYYLDRSKEVVEKYGTKEVLKTDLDNEAYDSPSIIGNIDANFKAIEIQKELVERCAKKGVRGELIHGDIRKLPWKNEFELVIDLSTLDHVNQKEALGVIKGYSEALKDNGRLLLITWTTDNYSTKDEQYFFSYEVLKKQLSAYFTVEEEKDLYLYPNHSNYILREFLCLKK